MADSMVASAVLVPVYRGDYGELRLLLVRRSERGVHGGELAFPGGKWEPGDSSLQQTALRETEEEIGLVPDSVKILEALPTIETISTGFRIAPFLARVVPLKKWRCEADEVAEVLDVSVEDLNDPERRGECAFKYPDWPYPRRVPIIRLGPHKLWGATYRILYPVLPRLVAGEWNI